MAPLHRHVDDPVDLANVFGGSGRREVNEANVHWGGSEKNSSFSDTRKVSEEFLEAGLRRNLTWQDVKKG